MSKDRVPKVGDTIGYYVDGRLVLADVTEVGNEDRYPRNTRPAVLVPAVPQEKNDNG